MTNLEYLPRLNRESILTRIAAAQTLSQIPTSSPAALLAVSKGHSINAIRHLAEQGQQAFGESYLQEALPKIAALSSYHLEWHFIGAMQANKTRQIARHFAWVQSLQNLKIAKRLNDQRPLEYPPLNVCIQVNIANDPAKSGLSEDAVLAFATQVALMPRLQLRGLMTIINLDATEAERKQYYQKMQTLFLQLREQVGFAIDTLSMGMSQDFEAAITGGSTMVRLGTVLFGERH